MVRFKAASVLLPGILPLNFHPTMVRFKALAILYQPLLEKNFHPTMVRFKVFTDDEIQDALDKISIPLWCDLKTILRIFLAVFCRISIPLWCDLKCLRESRPDPRGRISIPLWCDLKPTEPVYIKLDYQFPSHYGAI